MPRAIGKLKKCCYCKNVKNISEYHKNSKAHDGLNYICKPCGLIFVYRRTERIKRTPKALARKKLLNSIYNGKTIRPNNCSKCGVDCIPHGHHEDYSKPLDVIWLCRKCHVSVHAENRLNKIKTWKTKCSLGHLMSKENTVFCSNGTVICKVCKNARARKCYQNQRKEYLGEK